MRSVMLSAFSVLLGGARNRRGCAVRRQEIEDGIPQGASPGAAGIRTVAAPAGHSLIDRREADAETLAEFHPQGSARLEDGIRVNVLPDLARDITLAGQDQSQCGKCGLQGAVLKHCNKRLREPVVFARRLARPEWRQRCREAGALRWSAAPASD